MTRRYCRVCWKDRSGLITARKLDDEREEQNSQDYHEFTDEPSGTHEYYGDGQETDDFFRANSNFDDLIRSMNSDDIDAFQQWAYGWFMNGEDLMQWTI